MLSQGANDARGCKSYVSRISNQIHDFANSLSKKFARYTSRLRSAAATGRFGRIANVSVRQLCAVAVCKIYVTYIPDVVNILTFDSNFLKIFSERNT